MDEKTESVNGSRMVYEVLGRQTIEIYALRAEVLRLRKELKDQVDAVDKPKSFVGKAQ